MSSHLKPGAAWWKCMLEQSLSFAGIQAQRRSADERSMAHSCYSPATGPHTGLWTSVAYSTDCYSILLIKSPFQASLNSVKVTISSVAHCIQRSQWCPYPHLFSKVANVNARSLDWHKGPATVVYHLTNGREDPSVQSHHNRLQSGPSWLDLLSPEVSAFLPNN